MPASGLEQVQGPVGVDVEIRLGLSRRPIMRGLRGGVDDQLEAPGVLGEDPVDAVGVANVELERAELGVGGRPARAVVLAVDASGPKKLARMSFSSPTTSHPASTRWRTASDPTRPPDPVTSATAT